MTRFTLPPPNSLPDGTLIYPETYLDNPISPLPGALILAIPFAAVGNAALQTIFWIAVFRILTVYLLRDRRLELFTFALLILTPGVTHQIIVGSDLLTNALYVLILTVFCVQIIPSERHLAVKIACAILFGVSLSTRANFLLIAPPVITYIADKTSWNHAIRYATLIGITILAITLPFYFYDPTGFSPLHTASEISVLDVTFPYLGSILVPFVMLLCSLAYQLPWFAKKLPTLLLYLAILQAIPVVIGVIATSLYSGGLRLRFFSFGFLSLPFGLLAIILQLNSEKMT